MTSFFKFKLKNHIGSPFSSIHVTFYILHLSYFLLFTAFGTLALFLYPHDHSKQPVSFIDALYTAASAISLTGHMCLRMELLPAFDKLILLALTILGSHVLTSFLPLYLRRLSFRNSSPSIVFDHEVLQQRLLEYQALTTLSLVILVYFLGVQFAGYMAIELCVLREPHILHLLQRKHIDRTFFAIFSCVSAFSNSGLSLMNDSMVDFRQSLTLMLTTSVLILLGNTMFAPCLRFIIWLLYRFSKGNNDKVDIFGYLLEHPRKCYTHLFPRIETIWLVATVIMFISFQFLLLCTLEWDSGALSGLNTLHKLVDSIFQSIATRNAGEDVLNVANLSPPILVFYIGMMYISVYPVYLSRHSNDVPSKVSSIGSDNYENKLSMQSRKLLARDSAFIFIAVFIICLIESENISTDPLNYSIFNIFFEIISAYGNVGFSIGYSCSLSKSNKMCEDVPYSFSGKWSKGAKFILIVVMLLGRHRGLPQNIDSTLAITHSDETTIPSDKTLKTPSNKLTLSLCECCKYSMYSRAKCCMLNAMCLSHV